VNLLVFCGETISSSNSSISSEDSNSSSGSASSSASEEEVLKATSGIKNIGLAVFKEDQLVGKLSAIETMCHLIVTNDLKSCNISIPDPNNEMRTIDFYLTLYAKPKIKVFIINGSPYITIQVKTNARIASIDKISNNMTQEQISSLEISVSSYLEKQITNYLYKTAKQLHSDIAGIGKYALKQFQTNTDFMNYRWLQRYQDSFFQVTVNTKIKSSFLLSGD
jgi:spore germination protein KC